MEDAGIIELLFARSEQGIRELDAKYGGTCRRLSYNIVNDWQDAEECVNDAYLGAWNAIPPARPDPLAAYLCRIVRNISLNAYHRRGVQVETHPLPQEFIYPFTSSHRVHECGQSCLLCRCQAIPFVQHFALRRGKRNTRILFCKKLRQCNTKSIAYLFERCKRRCHRFFVPR